MAPNRHVIGEGHIHGVHADQLRKLQDVIRNAFTPNIRVSPLYDRDQGPGLIFFITIWTEHPENINKPRVLQKPLEWEAA